MTPRLFLLSLFLTSLALLGPLQPLAAQIPGFPIPGASAETTSLTVKRSRATVTLDNKNVFSVSAESQNKAEDRADLVSLRLNKSLAGAMEAGAMPSVTVRTVGADTVIYLGDQPLLTVTQEDTEAANDSAVQIGNDWATKIENALAEAQRERNPEFLREAAIQAAEILGVALLLHLAVWLLARRFFDRPGWPVLFLVWLTALNRIADLFPQTRPLHNAVREGVLRPLFIAMIVSLGAAAFSRLLSVALRHFFPPLPDTLSPEEQTVRTLRRRATLGTVARVTGATVIWTIAIVIGLSWYGVNLPALLTSAGLIGVAIGLAAQDTMKDLVAGINILIDDRYGVGDIIKVGEHQGTVETLNLRITQIRDISGRLITFPNRVIETVANTTQRWSQVDFQVGVTYDTDLRKAMSVMETTAKTLQEEWESRIVAPPQLLGVDSFNASDICLRMLVRTLPGDQWNVGRELHLRIKEAFDDAGIIIAYPHLEVTVVPTEKPGLSTG
jgi:small-conductance mechanosensitive channel